MLTLFKPFQLIVLLGVARLDCEVNYSLEREREKRARQIATFLARRHATRML